MTKARDIASAIPAPSTVDATELGYLDGVTSAIQTQLNAKQAVVSGVDDTEIGYLNGVTSAIQTQLDAKTAKSTLTTTGDIYYASSANTPARLGIGSTGNVLTVASGVPSWAAPAGGSSFVGAKSKKSAVQSLANATVSLITFDTDTFDTDAIHDTSTNNTRFTVPAGKGGYWSFTTQVSIDIGGGTLRQIRYSINGTVLNLTSITPISGDSTHFSRTDIFYLSAADYMEVGTYQDSGGAINILAANGTFAAFYYLGA